MKAELDLILSRMGWKWEKISSGVAVVSDGNGHIVIKGFPPYVRGYLMGYQDGLERTKGTPRA